MRYLDLGFFRGNEAGDDRVLTPGVLAPLAAHRAVYDLTLSSSTGNKAPASARGRIAFDFSGSACEGYVQNFRQITELQPAEGPPRLSDMRSATFETADGNDFRFKIETKIDNSRAEDIDGKAKKAPGAALSIDIAKPKRARLDLKSESLFPTQHLRRILAAARAGESILEAKVYDGSGDGAKVFDTLSVVGKASTRAVDEKAAQIDALKSMRHWPVAISYFEPDKKDQHPAYVLSFDLYENGISRALRLDYGDFVLAGEMRELTLLPAKTCKK
ncbi:MAG: cell envelope integrity EipB family protein [Methylocystis sp.]|nr:cell envelope integrity EipB family protein [Methylocystis sp.]